MRSKTSFFNASVFTKTMGRFWPLWAVYFAFWLLLIPVRLVSSYSNSYGTWGASAKYMMLQTGYEAGVVVCLVMGVLAAMAVWSFLYGTRSAYGTACLPLRRENLFFSGVAAGFVPVVGANLIIALLTGLAGLKALSAGASFGAAFQWFGIVTLIYLFYYGYATLCAQLTGSIIILPLVYAVLNFVAFVVETLLRFVLSLFVYGMSGSISTAYIVARVLSPTIAYYNNLGTENVQAPRYVPEVGREITEVVDYRFYGWATILIYAAVGVVMLAGALLLLRARRMETAGDVVAVKPLKPVFRWCMALGCALVLAALMYNIAPIYNTFGAFCEVLIFMLVGAFVGWFAAQMLMKKSFRVFKKGWSGWAGFGLCCLVIVALMLGVRFDLFGYERYVPAADRVESVWLNANGETVRLEEPENIDAAIALHESVIANKDWHEQSGTPKTWSYEANGSAYFFIGYNLRDGGTVQRSYDLLYNYNAPAGDAVALEELLNCREAIAYRKETDFPFTPETIIYGEVSVRLTEEEAAAAGLGSVYEYYYYDKYYGDAPVLATEFPPTSYYDVPLSAAEAWELYSTCLVPDFEDGTLGLVSIVGGEKYDQTFYDATVYIRAEREEPNGDYSYDYIRTTPTVDSRRTNAWLAGRGITLHLAGEE